MTAEPRLSPDESTDHDLRHWMEAETGMDLSGLRASRLRDAVNRLRRHNPGFDTALRTGQDRAAALDALTAELTVGESYFLRNEHHMQALRQDVLPSILLENAAIRQIRIWSAGCATGEEPYSIAICLDGLLPPGEEWRVSILGTDLNPEFLARAERGVFRNWSFRQSSVHHDSRYFSKQADGFHLADRLRRQVRFEYLNLVKDVYPSPINGTIGLDLILFRNVAIYLRPEVTEAILARFYDALRPGGWLLLGETELNLLHPARFEVYRFNQATFFRKPATAEVPPVSLSAPVLKLPSRDDLTPPQWSPLPFTDQDSAGSGGASEDRLPNREHSAPLSNEQLVAAKRIDEVEGLLANAVWPVDPVAAAATKLRTVQQLLSTSALPTARTLLEQILAEQPMQIEATLLMAGLEVQASRLREAETLYRRVLYLDSHSVIAHFQLALVLQRQADLTGCERGLRTVIRLAAGRPAEEIVEHGDGVCYGRLVELAQVFLKAMDHEGFRGGA